MLADLTFKVFPAAEAHATVRVEAGELDAALTVMAAVQRERFDLEAIDITPPGTVWLRLGGFAEALETRVDALRRVAGTRASVLTGEEDASVWRDTREFGWVGHGAALIRVPITLPRLRAFDEALAGSTAERRYSVAGNLAWVSWPGPVEPLDAILSHHGLAGQVLTGPPGPPFIGAVAANVFEERLRIVLDPSAGSRGVPERATPHPTRPVQPAPRRHGARRGDVRALRLLPGGVSDLRGARRGDGLAARAHRADEAGARGRPVGGRRAGRTSTGASAASAA